MPGLQLPARAPVLIRNATLEDLSSILQLNAEFEHDLSPADAARMEYLYECADHRRVLEAGAAVIGFMFAMRDGNAYDGDNYKWFADRYATFLYVDRIAVASEYLRQRLGQRLYSDLFVSARRMGVSHVTCEVNVDPPNVVSLSFHEKLGFRQVGIRATSSMKLVSLQASALADWVDPFSQARPDSVWKAPQSCRP